MPLTTVSPGMLDTTAQYYGFKNRIINGAMVIDQRNNGAIFTSAGLFYCVDRWLLQAVGATNTAQQVTGSTGNNKAVRITGNTSNTLTGFSQRIEAANIYDCASQTVTVSFTLYGSASGSVSVRFLYPTATDNYTSTTEPVAGTTVNFTTTATQYSVTRTLDSNANKGVEVYFDFGALGSGVTRTIEFVQLEKGGTATSFDYRDYGRELIMCQRYFEKSFNENTAPAHNVGGLPVAPIGGSLGCGGNSYWIVPLKVTKRISTYTVRWYDPLGAHPVTENWVRYITACDNGVAAGPNSNMTINSNTSNHIAGYSQVGTAVPPIFYWTVDAEL